MTYTQQDSGFAARETLDGDHDGPLTAEAVVRRLIDEAFSQGHLGHPPSGRVFRVYICDVMRVVGGRVVEHWGVPDRAGVLVQLGAIAQPSRLAKEA